MKRTNMLAAGVAVAIATGAPMAASAEEPARESASPTQSSPAEAADVTVAEPAAAAGPSGGRGLHAVPEVGDETKPGGCKACEWLRADDAASQPGAHGSPDAPALPAAPGQPNNRGYVVGKGGVARQTPGGGANGPSEPADAIKSAAIEGKPELAVEIVERPARNEP